MAARMNRHFESKELQRNYENWLSPEPLNI
jgi:hypothetical protein